jgi:hypothetical protein
MSVFISWSEKESFSHDGAVLLQKWLPDVLPNLESFVSSEDTASGSLWLQNLFTQLDKAESGILCLTKESLEKNWILFEAGALAKRAGTETGLVCPLLFEHKTLNFPLAAFQAHFLDKNDEIKSKKEMFLLIKTLNKYRQDVLRLGDNQLEKFFDHFWSGFWNPYVQLCEKHSHTKKPQTTIKITNEDILNEMRGAFRQFGEALTELRSAQFERSFNVICPAFQNENEVVMPDHAGATKPAVCNVCGSNFNVHVNQSHAAFARAIAIRTKPKPVFSSSVEMVHCPICQTRLSVELPKNYGATRILPCVKCNSTVFVNRTVDGVFARLGKTLLPDGPTANWQDFLYETQTWVEPSALITLISISVDVSVKKLSALSPDGLRKEIILLIEKEHSSILGKTLVRSFIKLMMVGGAFKFVGGTEPGWQTLFTNALDSETIIRACAIGAVKQLRKKFPLTSAELPELHKLLFPVEMKGAEDALRLAFVEAEKNSKQGLTGNENNR